MDSNSDSSPRKKAIKFDAIRTSGVKVAKQGKLKRNNSKANLYADPKGTIPIWGFCLPPDDSPGSRNGKVTNSTTFTPKLSS